MQLPNEKISLFFLVGFGIFRLYLSLFSEWHNAADVGAQQ